MTFVTEKPMVMDGDYERPRTENSPATPVDPWDDPAIERYLQRSRDAEQDRVNAELARIGDELTARDALHEESVTELEWHIEKYERELDRISTPFATKTEARERVTARLRTLRQELRAERRQHWQDRQQLARERRELLRERARLADEDVSELL